MCHCVEREAFIEVKGLTHIYNQNQPGEHRALDGVDLVIWRGEFLAVTGANGSGKSTLARHFNALLKPGAGQVLVNGLDASRAENVWEIRRQVGMVFQNPESQIVSTMVEEDVAFGAENLGLPDLEVRRRVDEALALAGLSRFRRHAPHLLSGGQKQRLAIAGVLAMRPSCLVLDEPGAMLDPGGRAELMDTLTKLNRVEGVTVVLVTHSMEEAVRADRVVVLSEGRIVIAAEPVAVFKENNLLGGLGLELPAAAEIALALRKRGFLTPEDILEVNQLVSFINDY